MMTTIPLSRAATRVAALLGSCLLAFACPDSVLAASTTTTSGTGENTPLNLTTTTTGAHVSSTSGGASLVRTIVGLAIVIAVIFGLSWILKQFKSGREPSVSSVGLASVAALTLGSGRSVHLVRAGNDYVLLGSAEQGLVPIHRYTQEQAREAGLTVLDDPALAPPRRSALGVLTAGPANRDPMGEPEPGTGFVGKLRELTVRR